MAISYDKGLYFFHRYLEGYDPSRALEKWNKGYPQDRATAEEIEAFLVDINNRREAGQKDGDALQDIVAGKETIDFSRQRASLATHPTLTVTEGEPPAASLPSKPKKKLFAKKENN